VDAAYVDRAAAPAGRVHVVVFDGDAIARVGIATILAEDSSIWVVGSEDNLERAVTRVRMSRVDTMVVGLARDTSVSRLETACADPLAVGVPVLLLADDPTVALTIAARDIGAAGLISKRLGPNAIRGAVHAVSAGAVVFPRAAPRPMFRLPSGREREIIASVRQGRTNDEIAAQLGLSARTVASHLRRCFARYGVASRTELAMLAMEQRWELSTSAGAAKG
jgi:DNA-binding NarL/FixJ family response regulator